MERYKRKFEESSFPLEKAEAILGGNIVNVSQFNNDPDLVLIFKKGKFFNSDSMIKVKGIDGRCHWNVAELYDEGKIDEIIIGYAENFQGWHQHTWGLKKGKVVETTQSNYINTNYFGYTLSKKEAKEFVKFSNSVRPGQGFMRTNKGGSIISHKGT